MSIGAPRDGVAWAPHICEPGAEAVDIRAVAVTQSERSTVENTPTPRQRIGMRELVKVLEAYALIAVAIALLWDELQQLLAELFPSS